MIAVFVTTCKCGPSDSCTYPNTVFLRQELILASFLDLLPIITSVEIPVRLRLNAENRYVGIRQSAQRLCVLRNMICLCFMP